MVGIDGKVPGAGECVVSGCGRKTRAGQLMCRTDWFRVTPTTRSAVNATLRAYLRGAASLGELRAVQEQAAREAEA